MNVEDIHDGFLDQIQFSRESLIVQTEDKRLVPMVLGPGQLRLNEEVKRQRALDLPVRVIYLKSRRIQATTGTAGQFFHDTAFYAGVHTAVLAHDTTSVENIFQTYLRFHNNYKPFGGAIRLPRSRPLSDRIYYEYGGDEESSFIQIHTAGSVNFGRSFRLTNVHFSEFPYYDHPLGTLTSVMSAVPKLPGTCAVIEGTVKTIGDAFHKLWQDAMDPSSASEWVGIFMGWWEHPDNRMRLNMEPDRFQESLTRDERELMRRFNLDLYQLRWRRYTIANDCGGDIQRFKREHPATPEEAFTAGSRNRFSIPDVQRMTIQRKAACGELERRLVGIEKQILFMPSEDGHGALRIYRRPEKGRLYAIGADCAQGIDVAEEGVGESDPDYSAAQVLDRDTGEQCAVLRARMMPGETGRYMAALGEFYNFAQIAGERNPGGGGVSMLEAILNADYPRTLLYHDMVQHDQDPKVRGDRLGWATTGVSRPILISMLDEAIRQGAIDVHDPITQQELLTFIIKASGKAEAQGGCHDDLVIALALAMVVIQRMPRPLPAAGQKQAPRLARYGVPPEPEGRGRIRRF